MECSLTDWEALKLKVRNSLKPYCHLEFPKCPWDHITIGCLEGFLFINASRQTLEALDIAKSVGWKVPHELISPFPQSKIDMKLNRKYRWEFFLLWMLKTCEIKNAQYLSTPIFKSWYILLCLEVISFI